MEMLPMKGGGGDGAHSLTALPDLSYVRLADALVKR